MRLRAFPSGCVGWILIQSVVVLSVAACGPTERHKRLKYFERDNPLGVGLSTNISVELIECDGPPTEVVFNSNVECEGEVRLEPSSFRFDVLGDAALLLESKKGTFCRDGCRVSATIEGAEPGTMILRAQIDELPALDIEFEVAAIVSSRLGIYSSLRLSDRIRREFDPETNVAFADSVISIYQQHSSKPIVNGEFPKTGHLLGSAELELLSGEAELLGSSLELPERAGVVQLETAVGGSLSIDVVEPASVATLLIVEPMDFGPLGGPIQLLVGESEYIGLVPLTESGEYIASSTFVACTDTEPTFACRVPENPPGPELIAYVEALAPGTAMMEFTLGDAAASMLVDVQ